MARAHRKETASALRRALHKPDASVKAADVLGFIGPAASAAVPDLLAACKLPDAGLRLHAALALVQVDPVQAPVAVEVLTALLKERDTSLQNGAAWGLGEIGPLAKDAVPALLRAYRDTEDKEVRFTLIEALGQIGPAAKESLPALIAILKDREGGGSGSAMGALYAFGPAARVAVPSLVQILKEGDPDEGLLAARALSRIDPARAKPGVPALAQLLHETMDFPEEGADPLGAIGPAAKEAIPALRKAMKQWPPEWRLIAVKALVRIDPAEARRNLPALRAALKHRKPAERCYAAAALGLIGPAAQAAVPDLVAALDDPEVRYAAAEALGRIGPTAADAVGPLLRMLRHSIAKRDRRKEGNQERQPTDPAEPSIREALKDPSLADDLAYARAVGELGTPISAATALELLDQRKDPQVRMGRIVCIALGRMGPASSEAVSALKDARKDREADVRLAAACALVLLDASQARDVLPSLRVALGDRDWTVRSAACSALATIGTEGREVAPALVSLLGDPVKYVRREAATALTQVDPNTAIKHGLP
jgi:HEAT repeat protein